MNLNTQSIFAQLDQSGVPLQDRGYLLSAALSRAIGYTLPLPTCPVENPYLHFTTQCKAGVESTLAAVNERLVIDIEATTDLICRVWVFRYRVAFEANNRAICDFLDAVVKTGNREIPPKLSEWLIRYENSPAMENLTQFIGTSLQRGS